MKAPAQSLCSMSCMNIVFGNGSLIISFQRATHCPSLGCLGISIGLPLLPPELSAAQFHHWEPYEAKIDSKLNL